MRQVIDDGPQRLVVAVLRNLVKPSDRLLAHSE
jgi:hypothetical protein